MSPRRSSWWYCSLDCKYPKCCRRSLKKGSKIIKLRGYGTKALSDDGRVERNLCVDQFITLCTIGPFLVIFPAMIPDNVWDVILSWCNGEQLIIYWNWENMASKFQFLNLCSWGKIGHSFKKFSSAEGKRLVRLYSLLKNQQILQIDEYILCITGGTPLFEQPNVELDRRTDSRGSTIL